MNDLPAHLQVSTIARVLEIHELEGQLVALIVIRLSHCRWDCSGGSCTLPYVYFVTDKMRDDVVALCYSGRCFCLAYSLLTFQASRSSPSEFRVS